MALMASNENPLLTFTTLRTYTLKFLNIKLALILDTTVAYVLGCEEQSTRSNAPTGKLRRLVDEVRELPRYQQQRVIATLEDALLAQRAKKAS